MRRSDVLAAADADRRAVMRTPLVRGENRGQRLWLKCECLQTGGAFKLRGATNRLLLLDDDGAGARRGRILVGQSCARRGDRGAAAGDRGDHRHAEPMRPRLKIDGTRARRGGNRLLRPADRKPRGDCRAHRRRDRRDGRAELRRRSYRRRAGDGRARDRRPTGAATRRLIAIPVGGGGLAAGIALACPESRILGVEPEGWDDMARSLAGG